MNSTMFKTLIIRNIIEEIKGFKLFVFDEGHLINYKAGQYLTLVHYANNEEIRRSYSITSAPNLNEPLSIGVKRIENGFFSRELVDRAKEGDKVITTGSAGFFILPENIDDYERIFLFAAGSGITPVFSILKSVLYNHKYLQVILVYSSQSPDRTIFYQSLIQLQSIFRNNLNIRFLFSNSSDLLNAHLHRELLEDIVNYYMGRKYSTSLFYICGPESYMRMCTYVLQEKGVNANNIKKENFVIQKPARTGVVPPDTEAHQVYISVEGKQYHINVNYPDSILHAAKKQGVILPYSCEAGRCGNCVARCHKGHVWLSYNEVLTEKELNKGLTLTCVGHPVGGDVTLEI